MCNVPSTHTAHFRRVSKFLYLFHSDLNHHVDLCFLGLNIFLNGKKKNSMNELIPQFIL